MSAIIGRPFAYSAYIFDFSCKIDLVGIKCKKIKCKYDFNTYVIPLRKEETIRQLLMNV